MLPSAASIARGVLPPHLVTGHPQFLRPLAGVAPARMALRLAACGGLATLAFGVTAVWVRRSPPLRSTLAISSGAARLLWRKRTRSPARRSWLTAPSDRKSTRLNSSH